MKEYLSHYSAAYMWNIPYLDSVFGKEAMNKRPGGSGEAGNQIVEITVTEKSAIRNSNNRVVHLCSLNLPKGAVVKRGADFVASPELTFVELAGELDFHRLVLLGMQLCSHSPGKPEEAVSSRAKLSSFAEKMQGHVGHKRALSALRHIEDGSASIMESLAYMILTLPHAFGGYGLRGASLNYEIPLSAELQKRLKQRRCFADIYYRKVKLAIEYDSFAYHHNPGEQSKDMMRASALERQGVAVLRLGTIQLYDNKACEEFAYNLAARLGRRLRIRAREFDVAHKALRSLLPERESEAEQEMGEPIRTLRPGDYL